MNAEELAGLGKIVKEIEPFVGLKIKVHSLTAKEEEEVFMVMATLPNDPLIKTGALQVETLTRAIEMIGTKQYQNADDLRTYLKSLQRHVLVALWESWMTNVEEVALKQIGDLKKNSETPAAA